MPHFDTLAVHALRPPGPGPTAPPIATASSYSQANTLALDEVFSGARPGHYYSRYGNPSTESFERAVAALEGTAGAVAFASGMAAIHAALMAAGVRSGDTVLASRDMYGVTLQLLNTLMADAGVKTVAVDACDIAAVRAALDEHRPRAVLVETLSNPLLRVADVPALADAAHAAGAALIVDSTFTTPYLIRPRESGVDIVVHSATKYLGGHGDALGGVAAIGEDRLSDLRAVANIGGAVLGPFEAALMARGIQTLHLRMARQCESAMRIARWLESCPEVERVYYAGLETHPGHDVASRLFGGRGFGGLLSFDLRDAGREKAGRFLDALTLAVHAPTLGDVTTLVMYPPMASHRSLTPEQRAALGIGDGLIRLSVGVEDCEDIIGDIERALRTAA
jgi:cystathionine gamma-synthase/methionine-gamma-lyase